MKSIGLNLNRSLDLGLDTDLYIEKKAKFLASKNDKELEGWLTTFKTIAKYSKQDINFDELDQKALELFVRKTGVNPLEAQLLGKSNVVVIPDLVEDVDVDVDVEKKYAGLPSISTFSNGSDKYSSLSRKEELLGDFELFCKECIHINYRPGMGDHSLNGGSGPFILTDGQKKIIAIIIDLFFNKKLPVRIQVLKSRQLGVTTLMMAFEIWLCYQIPKYTILFMIDKGPHLVEKRQIFINWVENTFEKYSDFATIKRRGDKVLELTNGSRILFESAESPNPGTSEMVQGLHLSERPKWPSGRSAQVKTSILPTIPTTRYTLVIDESTAEGEDDFKADWDRIHSGEGNDEDSDVRVVPIFLPWFLSKEYSKKPSKKCFDENNKFIFFNDDVEVCELDSDGNILLTEEQYSSKYNLSFSQIYWRRQKIKAPSPTGFGGDRNMFDQEYPTTPDHAWTSLGCKFYPHGILKSVEQFIKEPLFIGRIRHEGSAISTLMLTSAVEMYPIIEPDNRGNLFIYEYPEEGKEYFIGGDVAEGKLITTGTRNESDWCVISVIDEYGRDVALLRDHIPPEEMAYYLILLGRFFNDAKVNCERNKDGATVWSFFNPTGYPNIYYRDDSRGRISDLAWTVVGPGQRIPIMNMLRAAIREDSSRVRSRFLYEEMYYFIRKENGKVEPSSGKHDDVLFARAHAEVCRIGLTGHYRDDEDDEDEKELPDNVMESVFAFNGIEVF